MDMTRKIETAAKKYASKSTEIVAVSPEKGPLIITSRYDNAISVVELLKEVKIGERDGFDGFVIAAFIDTGLYEAREAANVPVIGIAEAAMHMACLLGDKFSIVTISKRMVPVIEELVRRYGLKEKCASIRVPEGDILAYRSEPEKLREALARAGKMAIKQDMAEVIILGGGAMAGLDVELEDLLGVPVIDGVVAAVKLVEAVCGYGKKTSKVYSYMWPDREEFKRYPEILKE
jgi:allantoin racemase